METRVIREADVKYKNSPAEGFSRYGEIRFREGQRPEAGYFGRGVCVCCVCVYVRVCVCVHVCMC